MTTKISKSTKSAAELYAAAYREHAAAALALREAEQALTTATAVLEAVWPAGQVYLETKSGVIKQAVKTSYSLTAEPAALVEFAKQHGLNTTEPKPASVAPATIRAAALRGVDVSSVAAETVSHVYSLN